MRRTLPLALGLALGLLADGGCNSGPQCVIDTDCAIGSRCMSDGTCQQVGARLDSGGTLDAGPRDAMVGEGGADTGPRDSGGGTDSGPCPDIAGTYTLTSATAECMTPVGTMVAVRPTDDGGVCSWTMTTPMMGPTGTFSVMPTGDYVGSFMIPGMPLAVACSGLFRLPASPTLSCGTCMITMTPTGP